MPMGVLHNVRIKVALNGLKSSTLLVKLGVLIKLINCLFCVCWKHVVLTILALYTRKNVYAFTNDYKCLGLGWIVKTEELR